jgi:DNA-binding NtrC family response regulator
MYENALGRRQPEVLLADDDQIRSRLRALLEAWGYEVEIARDGRCSQRILACVFAVITDVIMPRMTGLELLGRSGAISRRSVIVMTAHGTVEARRHAAAMGQ